ncbi:MAG TPA: HAMP domain-containing sensor histidine kinase [bacterium]|nr:HAMP domain-containing sensor histidine kinase [bacterium]
MLRRIRAKIQNKLIVTFAAFCLTIFSASGIIHYWYTESCLDEELGKKLLAVAQAAKLQIHTEMVSKLESGDENSRTYRTFKQKLTDLRDATDVERIYIIDPNGRSLMDTEEGVRIGYAYPFLKFNQYEFERAAAGLPSHSILFETYDGKLYKTAFVALTVNGQTHGVIAVDGSATFLYLMKRIEWHLITVGIIGVVVSVAIGFYFSRSISTPIKQIMVEAEHIGSGKLDRKIAIQTGDEVGFLGRTMDRMRENILKRDQYMKTMLAGVAHELRNPLGGMELYAHLLNKEIPDGDNRKKAILKVLRELDVMKQIVNDFLDYARPKEPQPMVCDLSKLIDEIRINLSALTTEKSVQWEVELNEKQVYADPGHLRQILINLIENAMQSGNVLPRVRIVSQRVNAMIEITVEDNGHGIEDNIKEKIFDPFFTTKEKGSGLGLAIVKKFVDENDGDITITSSGTNGTMVRLMFPTKEGVSA